MQSDVGVVSSGRTGRVISGFGTAVGFNGLVPVGSVLVLSGLQSDIPSPAHPAKQPFEKTLVVLFTTHSTGL